MLNVELCRKFGYTGSNSAELFILLSDCELRTK